jgi:hypothetical protein
VDPHWRERKFSNLNSAQLEMELGLSMSKPSHLTNHAATQEATDCQCPVISRLSLPILASNAIQWVQKTAVQGVAIKTANDNKGLISITDVLVSINRTRIAGNVYLTHWDPKLSLILFEFS